MTDAQNIRYRDILISPIDECANYTLNLGTEEMVDFHLLNFKVYMVQPLSINGWGWIIR